MADVVNAAFEAQQRDNLSPVDRYVSMLDTFRIGERSKIKQAIEEGDGSGAVKDAVLEYVRIWAGSSWVDGCVFRLGYWLRNNADVSFNQSIAQNAISGNTAWDQLIAGMTSATPDSPRTD